MIINLKQSSAKNEQQRVSIEIDQRLPMHLSSPCVINCQFTVKPLKDYYLIEINSDAKLSVTCQRCLGEFSHSYSNQSELAVCDTDEIAERLMNQYECIVSSDEIDLQELLTDELNLYLPEFHPGFKDCDHEIEVFIK